MHELGSNHVYEERDPDERANDAGTTLELRWSHETQ